MQEYRHSRQARRAFALLSACVLTLRAVPAVFANAAARRVLYGTLERRASRPGAVSHATSAWACVLDAFLRDVTSRRALEQVLLTIPGYARMVRLDELLIAAGSSIPQRCEVAFVAVDICQAFRHDSAIGYLRLADDFVHYGSACDPHHDRALALYRNAGQATQKGHAQTVSRAKAWFSAGQLLSATDPARASRAYAAAMAADPRDESGGYAWMSAVALAGLARQEGFLPEARRALDAAAEMPDLYHRFSESMRMLAELDALSGDRLAARRRLQNALNRDPGYAPVIAAIRDLSRLSP